MYISCTGSDRLEEPAREIWSWRPTLSFILYSVVQLFNFCELFYLISKLYIYFAFIVTFICMAYPIGVDSEGQPGGAPPNN